MDYFTALLHPLVHRSWRQCLCCLLSFWSKWIFIQFIWKLKALLQLLKFFINFWCDKSTMKKCDVWINPQKGVHYKYWGHYSPPCFHSALSSIHCRFHCFNLCEICLYLYVFCAYENRCYENKRVLHCIDRDFVFELKYCYLSILPLLGLGKLSCRRKTTFSTKCWMSPVSGPRTNTIQSWVKPSDVTFFLSWALWPSSSLTCTVHWKGAERN